MQLSWQSLNETFKWVAAELWKGGQPVLSANGEIIAAPTPWEIGLQPAHSPVKAGQVDLNLVVSGLMVVVVIFVAVLLAFTIWRFNKKRHPVARTTSHHTMLEVVWTLVPAGILLALFLPTMRLIYFSDRARDADLTVKVTGHQWYWEYGYPDQGNLHFDSYILPQDQLKPGQMKLLDVDNQLVLPVGKTVRILTTSADVIHSFFIPSLGVQRYAIPGHLIETWVKIDAPGVYYGECNQICGTNHSQMPIAIHAVSPAEFQAWLTQAKQKFSVLTPPQQGATQPTRLAAALDR